MKDLVEILMFKEGAYVGFAFWLLVVLVVVFLLILLSFLPSWLIWFLAGAGFTQTCEIIIKYVRVLTIKLKKLNELLKDVENTNI